MVEVIKLKLVAVSSWHLASYTGIHSKGRSSSRNNAWFQLFAHAWHFSRNLGNCYFGILPHKWLLLVTVMMRSHHPWLTHNLATQPRDSDWKPWRNDHVVIVFLFTLQWCILINKYNGCVIMQIMEQWQLLTLCMCKWLKLDILSTSLLPLLHVNAWIRGYMTSYWKHKLWCLNADSLWKPMWLC